jgi:TatD family-associated radical SAM protein
MLRSEDLIEISKKLKTMYDRPIRINTNGHANLICGQDITPRLRGLIDAVSISMNAPTAKDYLAICRPRFGEAAFAAMLDFAGKCREQLMSVTLSVVDVLPRKDIKACREIAAQIGVDFRIRRYIE